MRSGRVAVLRDEQGPLPVRAEATSERTQQLVDAEVRRIVAAAYDDVLDLLREHREQLDALADALMDRETLDEADAYAAASITRHNTSDAVAVAGS